MRDPDSLYNYLLRFSEWQAEKNYSPRTIGNRETALRYFIAWAADRGLTQPQEITKPILEGQVHPFTSTMNFCRN